MKKRILIVLTVCLGILPGCAELELASHAVKQSPIPSSSKTKGTFKVGNPYKIAGKRYYPKETYSFEQTGVASWYGPNFHGKKTANGETFDMYELTAAHKTLQMPSLVRVTNIENGKSIVVRINDRGPFSKNRIIDLSKKGAELLGFKNQGTARVKVQVLTEESRKIAHAAKQGYDTSGTEVAMNQRGYQQIAHRAPARRPVLTRPQAPVAQNARVPAVETADIQTSVPGHVRQGRFYPDPIVQQRKVFVQAASLRDAARAENLASSLQRVGNAHVQPAIVNGQNFYRVRIGPLASTAVTDDVLAQLAMAGQNNAIVVVD